MKEKTNNITTSTGKTIVGSYEELLQIIQQSIKQHNEIRFVNLLITFKVDIYTLLSNIGIPTDSSTDTLFVDYPVIIDSLVCKEAVFDKISFNKEFVSHITSESEIGRLAFFDCFFNCASDYSFRLEDTKLNEFEMNHCTSNSSVCFDVICCSDNFKIDEVEIKGALIFRNFRLLQKKDTELYLGGKVCQDVNFFNCSFFKKTIVNVETEGSIKYEYINYDIMENADNSSKLLRQGSICMNGTTIGKQLVFLSCNIGAIDLINVTVESIKEFELRYTKLKNQAATILRNGANQRNDDIAYAKYTADIYDDYLRSISVRPFEKMLHWIDACNKGDSVDLKKMEHRYKWKNFWRKIIEPFRLMVLNLFSEEGLLLWLNKYSNNYNRSWFRGVIFTSVMAFLAYFLLNYCGMKQQFFVIDWSFRGFGEVFVGYLSLLDIFNLIGDKPEFELTNLGKTLMFICKIIIAYGEWQTIYAFYKYKK